MRSERLTAGRHSGVGSTLALTGVAVAVVAAAALGRLTAIHAAVPKVPPVLDLAGFSAAPSAAGGTSGPAVGAAEGSAPDPGSATIPPPVIGLGTITVIGKLPTEPASAPVVELGPGGPVAESTVLALAAALDLTATPKRTGHSWTVGSGLGQPVLTVEDSAGHPWNYLRGDLGCTPIVLTGPRMLTQASASITCMVANGSAVTAGGSANGSAVTAGPPTVPVRAGASSGSGQAKPTLPQPALPRLPGPVVIGPAPSNAIVLALSRPVFEAVGLDPGQTSVSAGFAHIDPAVDGRPTIGMGTSVLVSDGRIVSANGWLAQPVDGPSYPLITAQAALTALRGEAVPQIAIACPVDTNCEWRTQVLGARLGLELGWDRGTPVLVPAWIYRTRVLLPGQTQSQSQPGTLTAIAVAPAFLGPPAGTVPIPPGTIAHPDATPGSDGAPPAGSGSGQSIGAPSN
jgi:hypothetical protein